PAGVRGQLAGKVQHVDPRPESTVKALGPEGDGLGIILGGDVHQHPTRGQMFDRQPECRPADALQDDVEVTAQFGGDDRGAQAPLRTSPTTLVPGGGPLPSAAGRSTTPATSQPAADPGGFPGRSKTSPRFRDEATTRTKASPGRGTGSATSASATCGAAPILLSASTTRP